MNKNIIIEDTTLRDGEQSPDIAFSKTEKIAIYQMLVNTGVKWIEAGIPSMKGTELLALQEMNEMATSDNVNLLVWNRGILEDVQDSIRLGFKAIHIGLPTSDIHLNDSINKDRSWLLSKSADLIKFAKDNDVFVSISAEDVGRTSIDFLQEYANNVQTAGADRLRLSDTIGILTPDKYTEIIHAVRSAATIDLQCHAHNDFGLAVANTIAAIKAGVRYFHVTINGIGERAGMADISQVTMALKLLHNIDIGIKTELLKELSEFVARCTNIKIYPWQPIVGNNVFAHESGIHSNATLKNTKTFEPFPPELVGGHRRIVIGKHSGRSAIKNKCIELGVHNLTNDTLDILLQVVREAAIVKKSSLNDQDIIDILKELA